MLIASVADPKVEKKDDCANEEVPLSARFSRMTNLWPRLFCV